MIFIWERIVKPLQHHDSFMIWERRIGSIDYRNLDVRNPDKNSSKKKKPSYKSLSYHADTFVASAKVVKQ